MKCLVTGATGFLGRYVVRHLQKHGHHVTLFGRQDPGNVPCILGDLSRPLDLGDSSFEVVYHIGGLAHIVPRTEDERRAFHTINTLGTEHLLQALRRSKALPRSVVLISTIAVYGLDEGELLPETTEPHPHTPYGESKRAAELLLDQWCARNGVCCGIVRLPLVSGQGAPGNLGAMVQALRKGRYFGIGRGDASRSIVRADDVARILPKIAEIGGIYHLTDGHNPSLMDLETALSAALGKALPFRIRPGVAHVAARFGDVIQRCSGIAMPIDSHRLSKLIRTLTVSDELAQNRLGWSPERVIDHVTEIL